MATEPTDLAVSISPSQGPWAPSRNPWSQYNYGTGNSTSRADDDQPFLHFNNIISLVAVLISLCGTAGNGAVVWLLGFRLKRSPFSVYILNLACADGAYLLSTGVWSILRLLHNFPPVMEEVVLAVQGMSQMVGPGLLMAISTERCVSVLWPVWYRCRRPAHLSCAVCVLLWGLGLCAVSVEGVCEIVDNPCDGIDWFYLVMVIIAFLVLCMSSLMLLMWVQCSSWGTQPGRLHMTVLLTVLAFLLLGLPYSVYILVLAISSSAVYIPVLWDILRFFSLLNCMVKPIIYFFMGRYRRWLGRTPLQEVLQRVLQDEEEGAEQRCIPSATLTQQCPLNPREQLPGDPSSELDKTLQQG